ncbi:MAG: lysophospholipase [Thermodesulfobacteriota bacterium]|nr:lysophospholipase [Thermodesulfobacteriota bacterium]
MEDFTLQWQTEDGLTLAVRRWEPEREPKAVICLVHGLGEHSGRYHHWGVFLKRAGYALLAFDLRGHGRSQGQRGYAPKFRALLQDISLSLEEGQKLYPGRPLFLYGHSMGGMLVLNYVLRHHPKLAGVIVTSPLLRTAFAPPVWKVVIGRIMYYLWPTLSLANELDCQGISRDPEVVHAYQNDPLVHDRLTPRLGIDILRGGLWALEHANEFTLPLLLMHGDADSIVSAGASGEFALRAGNFCTLKIWPGLYHELHNEPEKDQVLSYLLGWLDKKI